MANLTAAFRGVIPVAQQDSQGVEFNESFYNSIIQRKLPVYQMVEKLRGRGKQRICEPVGEANVCLKHRILHVQGLLHKEVYNKPYMRLVYSYTKGADLQIDLSSVGLLLSEDPGHLTESNYEIIKR